MADEREPKRIRQACQNCRRKKTRCSGERPICAFCARLKQDCFYEEGHAVASALGESNPTFKDMTLATRVALLEAKLSLLSDSAMDISGDWESEPRHSDAAPALASSPESRGTLARVSSQGTERQISDVSRKFTVLPPLPVLRSITEIYFQRCHNQPYCYFDEHHFRRRLEQGDIHSYLLMAVMALAGRFCQDPYFEGQQQIATETFSRTAWAEIFQTCFAEDGALDISVVQAVNMLAVVDFTIGQHKLAWVKIGLAVRFAQSLQLNNEPPKELSIEQQEERVFTFWSVYLLDRLVSCGCNKPPTISDADCRVRLPSDSSYLVVDSDGGSPTLGSLYDIPESGAAERLDHFAHTIFMASALGRIERYSLQRHSSSEPYPAWDSRGDYMKIHSILLSFETYSDSILIPFPDAIDQWYTIEGTIDRQAAGHFVFSVVLYHLNHCLLNHPFLLRQRLANCKTRVPPSFLKEALRRGRENAQLLTIALRTVQQKGLTLTSFYGYACTVAGTIHRLFMLDEDANIARNAQLLFRYTLTFLETGQGIWGHYPRMAAALKQLNPDPKSIKELITAVVVPTTPTNTSGDESLDVIWDYLDYGWLSDSARPTSSEQPADTAKDAASDLDIHFSGETQDDAMFQPSFLDAYNMYNVPMPYPDTFD